MSDRPVRTSRFARNRRLEDLLAEVNELLGPANGTLREQASERYSKVFVVGPLRSGTTLVMQWLASTGIVAYPSNLLSRFYGAPLVGAKIQQLLTDPAYRFRDELQDLDANPDFASENGKTSGTLAPNEFWYFWRRFLPFEGLDYLSDGALRQRGDLQGLRDELNALANIFGRPFALKAMIMNQNLAVLNSLFSKSLFLWVEREPVFNIQSALEARRRQHGNLATWYSFKIREYDQLASLEPLDSVAGQIHAIHRSIGEGLALVPNDHVVKLRYEEFCAAPARVHAEVIAKLDAQDGLAPGDHRYRGPSRFRSTNVWRLSEYSQLDAETAYARAQVTREGPSS